MKPPVLPLYPEELSLVSEIGLGKAVYFRHPPIITARQRNQRKAKVPLEISQPLLWTGPRAAFLEGPKNLGRSFDFSEGPKPGGSRLSGKAEARRAASAQGSSPARRARENKWR